MIEISEKGDASAFRVRVVPRASRTEIAGEIDGALKVRVASAPVDGAANEELIRYLSKFFGVSRGAVTIAGGQTSKNKLISISGISAESIRSKIA